MKACEIFHVPYKKTYRWKWRHTAIDGRTLVESDESYALYYECYRRGARSGLRAAPAGGHACRA